jgi:hypothetical protein
MSDSIIAVRRGHRWPVARGGAVAGDDRCNIENITEGLRVIADGPILCQAGSGDFV